MSLQRPWRLILSIAAVIVVLAAVYVGWLAWQVNKHLSAASDDARALQSSIKAGDEAGIAARFDAFAQEAQVAHKRTDSIGWKLLTHVPGFGDDAEGVQVVSRVAASLTSGSLKDLAAHLADLDQLAPKGGAVNLDAVTALQQPVIGGAKELTAARAELAKQDPSGYIEKLKLKFRDLQKQISDAADGLNAASGAVQVMPEMLGADGTKTYLLVMQNNAEVRSTGGLPGAVSVLNADDGKLTMTKQVAGNELGEAPKPVLELTNGEINAYGDILGTFFLDANLQPDWGRASDLMAARWKQVYGQDVDGVVSLDPIALSYLLKVTGPVTVHGQEIGADNAVSLLLNQVYVDVPDPEQQDLYFRAVAAAVFQKLTGSGVGATKLLPALRQGVDEGRILLHSFDDGSQKALAGTKIAGEVAGRTDDPTYQPPASAQVGVYFNEGTSSKLSYYVHTDLKVMATSCANGVQTYTAHLKATNALSPADVAKMPPYVKGSGEDIEAGTAVPILSIYGPTDGSISQLQVSDAPDAYQADITDYRRPIKQLWLDLAPGETKDLTWTMKSGKGQTGSTDLSVTPTITPGTESASIKSVC